MKLKIISNCYMGGINNHKNLNIPRRIIKKQTNAIKFEGGSWLGLGSTGEKASDFSFDDNTFTVKGIDKGEFIKYQIII